MIQITTINEIRDSIISNYLKIEDILLISDI